MLKLTQRTDETSLFHSVFFWKEKSVMKSLWKYQ